MKKIIVLLLLSYSASAFAICEKEREERDKFRNLCLTFSGISTGIATYGGIATGGWGGVFGVFPGLVAHNQHRIWQEKEKNLADCERNYASQQAAELQRQQANLASAEAERTRVEQVNFRFDHLENEAKDRHTADVRNLMQNYMQQGLNLRDPLVQSDLRHTVQRMKTDLAAELEKLTEERKHEIN